MKHKSPCKAAGGYAKTEHGYVVYRDIKYSAYKSSYLNSFSIL